MSKIVDFEGKLNGIATQAKAGEVKEAAKVRKELSDKIMAELNQLLTTGFNTNCNFREIRFELNKLIGMAFSLCNIEILDYYYPVPNDEDIANVYDSFSSALKELRCARNSFDDVVKCKKCNKYPCHC